MCISRFPALGQETSSKGTLAKITRKRPTSKKDFFNVFSSWQVSHSPLMCVFPSDLHPTPLGVCMFAKWRAKWDFERHIRVGDAVFPFYFGIQILKNILITLCPNYEPFSLWYSLFKIFKTRSMLIVLGEKLFFVLLKLLRLYSRSTSSTLSRARWIE
jgi:hypothetical protein